MGEYAIAMKQGCDISVWNGAIDFAKMATQAQFVFVRAAYANFVDRAIDLNWINSKKAGLVRGAYLYMTATVNPVDQATTLFKALRGDLGELPPVLDLEDISLTVPNIQRCMQEMERLFGRTPIIYTGNWWVNQLRDKPSWLALYPLWIAQWYNNWMPTMRPDIPLPWTTYSFWQTTNVGDGASYGCQGKDLDLDVFNGTDEDWSKLTGAHTISVKDLPITISEGI